MRRLYTLLGYLGLPLAAGLVAWRAWRERAAKVDWRERTGWAERFGFGAARAGGGVWVHAASAGEVQVAAILIGALREQQPALELTLTCATPGGRARAHALLPQVEIRYAPFDLPGSVRRCLARLRPRLLVLIETELWPNLLHEAQRAAVPTLIASARLSARSARRYARLPGLLRGALRSNVRVGAQTAADAQRFRALGVPAERVSVLGNLKFDRILPPDLAARGAALRARYAAGRAVWIAGSTHPAETPLVLDAHRQVQSREPRALLIFAPRHLHRLDQTLAAVAASQLRCRRRSQDATSGAYDVLLLDTLGELMEFYAAADVAFVGGSLIAIGGHNLLEPAALGLPVLAGPEQFNSPEVARVLADCGGLTIVADAATLAQRVAQLLADPQARARQGALARAALDAHRGALANLLAQIQTLREGQGAAGAERRRSGPLTSPAQ